MRVWWCCIDSAYFQGMGMQGFQLRSPAAIRRRGRASHPGLRYSPSSSIVFPLPLTGTIAIHPRACMQGQEGQVQQSHSRARGCSTQFVRNSSFAECASYFSGALLKNEFRRAQAHTSTDFQFQPGHPGHHALPEFGPITAQVIVRRWNFDFHIALRRCSILSLVILRSTIGPSQF